MNIPFSILTSLEARLLSEIKRRRNGATPLDLVDRTGISRASVYLNLRRLTHRKFVTRRADEDNPHPTATVYEITDKGLLARRQFAADTGLKP